MGVIFMTEKITRVGISMPTELRDDVKVLAKSKGLDVSSLVRMLLISEIKKEKVNDKKK